MCFGYAQTVPAITTFRTSVQPAELEHVRTHHQVRVPVAARVGAVRADAADLGCQVEHELGFRVVEEALRVCPVRQVVALAPRHERRVPGRLQPLDEMRAEEAAASGHEDAGYARAPGL